MWPEVGGTVAHRFVTGVECFAKCVAKQNKTNGVSVGRKIGGEQFVGRRLRLRQECVMEGVVDFLEIRGWANRRSQKKRITGEAARACCQGNFFVALSFYGILTPPPPSGHLRDSENAVFCAQNSAGGLEYFFVAINRSIIVYCAALNVAGYPAQLQVKWQLEAIKIQFIESRT